MKKNKVTIILIRSYNLSARIIHIGMFLWYILRFKKPIKCYNHCEVKYGDSTSGAISKGVKTRNYEEYLKDLKKYKLLTYDLDLTKKEYENGLKYLEEAEGKKYEFENFLFHAFKIFSDKWYGDTSASELYCYEHVIRFLNSTGKYNINPFLNPVEAENLFNIIFK